MPSIKRTQNHDGRKRMLLHIWDRYLVHDACQSIPAVTSGTVEQRCYKTEAVGIHFPVCES